MGNNASTLQWLHLCSNPIYPNGKYVLKILLNGQSLGGHLPLRLPNQNVGGTCPPVPPIIAVGLLWKNVAYFPFNSWLSFQRLCRLLWRSSICSDDSQEARHARRMHSRKHASFAPPKHFLRECTNFGCCTPIFTTAQTATFSLHSFMLSRNINFISYCRRKTSML